MVAMILLVSYVWPSPPRRFEYARKNIFYNCPRFADRNRWLYMAAEKDAIRYGDDHRFGDLYRCAEPSVFVFIN